MRLLADEQHRIAFAFISRLVELILKQQARDCARQWPGHFVGQSRNVYDLQAGVICSVDVEELRQNVRKARRVWTVLFHEKLDPRVCPKNSKLVQDRRVIFLEIRCVHIGPVGTVTFGLTLSNVSFELREGEWTRFVAVKRDELIFVHSHHWHRLFGMLSRRKISGDSSGRAAS